MVYRSLNLFTLKTIQHSDLIETLYFEEVLVRRFIEYRKRNQQKMWLYQN